MPITKTVLTEEELTEIALLKYAQQRATKWGAERFAAEFRRRELEEQWLEAARTDTTPYTPRTENPAGRSVPAGPVDASAQDRAIGSSTDAWVLTKPKYARHASVPRPPAPEPEERRPARFRRRRRERTHRGAGGWQISPAEAARMSAAGRRLYGLEEPRDSIR